ncbi:MAG: TIGR00730 family Rossman fold protein [Verrucomicrobiota bacterium]
MPKVRLSGTIFGSKDPNREIRARILYHLFATGWDIDNSNGDQRITLNNIEATIIESDAFVFMPGAEMDDLFKAISIFVGYQTLDPNLSNKATVIMNSDASWNPLFDLFNDLERLGTIRQNYRKFLLPADSPDEVVSQLERVAAEGVPDPGRSMHGHGTQGESFETPLPKDNRGNVCVFCSASIEDTDYLNDGYKLGKQIAESGFGCVSGAGTTGVMGTVVQGSVEAGGWTGGSNVPHIIEIEGLPNGLSSFWLKPDIYTRMEIMIERSDAFIIFPGGAGTVQEMLALLIFKQMDHELMRGKPIVIFNRTNPDGETRFWDKLVEMLVPWQSEQLFTVVNDLDQLMPEIESMLESVPSC